MAYFKLLIAVLAMLSCSAFAGYAQLVPPVGWSAGASGASVFNVASRVAANEATFVGGTVLTNAALNVGGRSVVMPVSMRLAANAGTVIASTLSLNPYLLAATVVAPLVLDWYSTNKLIPPAIPGGDWKKLDNGIQYRYPLPGLSWMPTKEAACASTNASNYGFSLNWCAAENSCKGHSSDPTGSIPCYGARYVAPESQTYAHESTLTPPQAANVLAPLPYPPDLPIYWPEPLPVAVPVVNPTEIPAPRPLVWNPTPQPLRVPQGEPVPVPNTEPKQWRTPVIDIVPSPIADDPWRVDVQPKDIIKLEPSPIAESAPVPDTPPEGQTEAEKTPDLCEKNPDILACQKLGEPTDTTLEKLDKTVSISPLSGWGAESASCPAPRHLTGANVDFSFQPICDLMSGLRPIIIAVAWLSAAFILLGFKSGE